jgi:uncharacterized membrane protein (UPF0127 family)
MKNSIKFFLLTIISVILISCFFKKNKISQKENLSSNNFLVKSNKNFNQDFSNYNQVLEIVNENNQVIFNLYVAVADDDEKRITGLMNLKKLPEKNGMIFYFPTAQKVDFWMKNTLIPLDIIFIDSDNKIVNIHQNAIPMSEKLISSQKAIVKVLEINAGLVKKYKIKIGNKIISK